MKKRRKFTLVELLVVIAIIVLLLALLMPGLKSARECAYSAVCHGNQRQIGVALFNYASDWKCYIPFGNSWNSTAWYRKLDISTKIMKCPPTEPTASATNPMYEQIINVLLANGNVASYENDPRDLKWFPFPSASCYLMCSQKGSSNSGITRYTYWNQEIPKYTYATATHGNGRNVLYIDGHSAYMDRLFPPKYNQKTFWQGWDSW